MMAWGQIWQWQGRMGTEFTFPGDAGRVIHLFSVRDARRMNLPPPDRGPSRLRGRSHFGAAKARSAAASLVERRRNAPDHLDRATCAAGWDRPALIVHPKLFTDGEEEPFFLPRSQL